MNEEIAQAFNQFIANSLNLLDNGVDFAREQIPLVLQEIIRWKTVESATITVLSLIVVIFSIITLYKAGKKAICDNNDEYCPVCFIGFIFFLISSPIFIWQLLELLKVLSAPRLVLIEYLKGLM